MDDWDQFQHQMDLDIPENLDLNEICEYCNYFHSKLAR
jgi:hypothetical protein